MLLCKSILCILFWHIHILWNRQNINTNITMNDSLWQKNHYKIIEHIITSRQCCTINKQNTENMCEIMYDVDCNKLIEMNQPGFCNCENYNNEPEDEIPYKTKYMCAYYKY